MTITMTEMTWNDGEWCRFWLIFGVRDDFGTRSMKDDEDFASSIQEQDDGWQKQLPASPNIRCLCLFSLIVTKSQGKFNWAMCWM